MKLHSLIAVLYSSEVLQGFKVQEYLHYPRGANWFTASSITWTSLTHTHKKSTTVQHKFKQKVYKHSLRRPIAAGINENLCVWVRQRGRLYLHPEGSSINSPRTRWLGSAEMDRAFFKDLTLYRSQRSFMAVTVLKYFFSISSLLFLFL